MSGLSEVSRLFAGRAGDLEKAREIFTAETRSYVSAILAAIQRTRAEPWLSARTRIDFPSEIEAGAKNGSLANQYASARVTLRFKKGTKFMPVADVVFGIEYDQSSEAFVWRVSLIPGARYLRLDDVIWRQFKTVNAEYPGSVHDERANIVRFVQRSLGAELSPEANFNDVKGILEFLIGADGAIAEAVGVDAVPGEEAALG
jgi:hypothetical protein